MLQRKKLVKCKAEESNKATKHEIGMIKLMLDLRSKNQYLFITTVILQVEIPLLFEIPPHQNTSQQKEKETPRIRITSKIFYNHHSPQ